jgi:phosphatidate cytidylyltransferase
MFLQRFIVTLILGPLAIWLIVQGGFFYFIPLTLVLLLGTWEYANMMRKMGWHFSWVLLALPVFLLFVDGQFGLGWDGVILMLGLLGSMIFGLVLYETKRSGTAAVDWLAMNAGIFWLGWLGSHFFRLRNFGDNGWQWTIVAMVSIWVADSAAYVVGKNLGKHKLSPRLSPNKTIEGYVGGVILGIIGALIVATILDLPYLLTLLISATVTTIAPLGDLGVSLLKREANIKDSGTLLPGHGGALDRTDSLVWAVALAYYLLYYFS